MSFVILYAEVLQSSSFQCHRADETSMADNHRDFELEHKLKVIKETILAELPSYLATASGTRTKHHSKEDKPAYRVLDCYVKLADHFQLAFHAASVMYEAVINLEHNDNQKQHYVIVKTMPDSAVIRKLQNSPDLFFNEIKAYSEFIPMLLQTCAVSSGGDLNVERPLRNLSAAKDLFPKCYCVAGDSGNEMIVLQNLRIFGYGTGGDKLMSMDYEHIVVALEGLARFHALSYGTKKKDFRSFEERVIAQIRDPRRFVKQQTTSDAMTEGYQICLGHTAMMVFDKFNEKQLEEGGLYTEKLKRVRRRVENCAELIRELLMPEEPLAVLCHGDFNRNNIMFRCDSDNKPCDVKFIDFQTPFYASPAIDLSFLLFVNASPELWATRWNDMFSVYHRTILDALSEFLNCSQETLQHEFSREAFECQFSKYMLYGFLLATSFIVANAEDPDKLKVFELFNDGVPTVEELFNVMEKALELAGAEVLGRVLSLTKEMLDRISP